MPVKKLISPVRKQMYRLRHWLSGKFNSRSQVFTKIYNENKWADSSSRSGLGSNLTYTTAIRERLPSIVSKYEIHSILDIPCGDFFWMQEVDLDIEAYIGADIVSDVVDQNESKYGNSHRRFQRLDLVNDDLPRVDMVFCRDCLVHLSLSDAIDGISNVKKSGAKYFMTTTFTDETKNIDISTGMWRKLNLQQPPFNFPPPLELINEEFDHDGGWAADKAMGLWMVDDIP